MKQVVRERDGPVMSGRSRNISAQQQHNFNICTLGVKDIDEATRNEMANKNKSNTTKTRWNVASSLGKKKPVQLGREPSKKCILNYTALNESWHTQHSTKRCCIVIRGKENQVLLSATWLVTLDILLAGWRCLAPSFLENQMTQHPKNFHDTIFNQTKISLFSLFIIYLFVFSLILTLTRAALSSLVASLYNSFDDDDIFPLAKRLKSHLSSTHTNLWVSYCEKWMNNNKVGGGGGLTHTETRAEVDNFSTEPPP